MLNSGDKLGGLVGQSMGGPKVVTVECPSYPFSGSFTFTAPRAGWYKFVAWGAGGLGDGVTGAGYGGGGSGAYGEITRYLGYGERVAVVVGAGGVNEAASPVDGGSTTLTFADGKLCTAGGGKKTSGSATGGLGGTATGFDVNIDGSQGGSWGGAAAQAGGGTNGGAAGAAGANNAGGAGAPANHPYKGGSGLAGDAAGRAGTGAGAGAKDTTNHAGAAAGSGAVIIQFVRPF